MTLDLPGSRFFAVDRCEGEVVVLVGDDGISYDVPRAKLPRPLREGQILVVALTERGEPNWSSATVDPEETARRMALAKDVLDRLQRRDPGGDVTL